MLRLPTKGVPKLWARPCMLYKLWGMARHSSVSKPLARYVRGKLLYSNIPISQTSSITLTKLPGRALFPNSFVMAIVERSHGHDFQPEITGTLVRVAALPTWSVCLFVLCYEQDDLSPLPMPSDCAFLPSAKCCGTGRRVFSVFIE